MTDREARITLDKYKSIMSTALHEVPSFISQGTKHDLGKDRWDLAPWEAFGEVVKILTFGAGKYGDRNWERGIVYSRLFAATVRHLSAWWRRDDLDPESGRSHLAHVLCCVAFILTFTLRGRTDLDNRPKVE